MIENIASLLHPFINPSLRQRIIYYSKTESVDRFKELLS